MDVNTVLGVAASAVVVVTAIIAGARYVGKKLGRFNDNWDEFRGDWYGQPARPGRPAQPGVMERLGKIEAAIADTSLVQRVGALERQMDDVVRAVRGDRAA